MKSNSEIGKRLLCACKSTALTVALCAALLALCSGLILGGVIPQKGIFAAASACSVLAAFAGTFFAMKGQKEKILGTGLLGCGLYLALLLLASLVMPGQSERSLLPMAALCLISAALGCVLAGRKPRRSPVKHRRR